MAKQVQEVLINVVDNRVRVFFATLDDAGVGIGSGTLDVSADMLPAETAQWRGLVTALAARIGAKL